MAVGALRPGDRLGRYELRARIGVGGGREVWEALFLGPDGFRRRVAIKLLVQRRTGLGTRPEALLHEARLGALVYHPNVVSTLELGEHEGRWFLVMDLVRGQSCDQLLKARGAFPAAALLDVLARPVRPRRPPAAAGASRHQAGQHPDHRPRTRAAGGPGRGPAGRCAWRAHRDARVPAPGVRPRRHHPTPGAAALALGDLCVPTE